MSDDGGSDDEGRRELGTLGKIHVAKNIHERRQDRKAEQNQSQLTEQYPPPPLYPQAIEAQPGQYPPPQHIVVQPQPGAQVIPGQEGVMMSQPVAFMQGAWNKPDLCGLCCDKVCCYACCCWCCARGEQAELMGDSYVGAFLLRMFCWLPSLVLLCGERDRIRRRFNIPATDGCCTVCWCEPCVVAQHLYQLRPAQQVPQVIMQ